MAGAVSEMNRKELTYRLSLLGLKKQDFAKLLGMAPDTLYQWDEPPQYAVALLESMEEVERLKRTNVGLQGVIARKK